MKNIPIKLIFTVIVALCILAGIVFAAWMFISDIGIMNNVLLEAGKPIMMEMFFEEDVPDNALFVTNIEDISTTEPGSYAIDISVGDKMYTSTLTVRDTTEPVVNIKSNITVWNGKPITARECVESIEDVSYTRVEWLMEPDDIPGTRKGVILVTDSSGNSTKADVTVTVVKDIIPPEIEGVQNINACLNDDITLLEHITVTDNKDPQPAINVSLNVAECYVAGEYPVKYVAEDAAGNKTEAECTVILSVDNTAPQVIYKDVYNIPVSDGTKDLDITSLIKTSDNSLSALNIKVDGEVNQSVEGSYPVVFSVSDKTGNTTVAECTVNVGKDITPPTVNVNTIQIFAGDSVSYKNHMIVSDDFVGETSVEIDSSNVNLDIVGEYYVSFTVTDASGNVTTLTAPVSVVERPPVEEDTHKMIDDLIARLIKPSMTDLEKLWAIYDWTNTNIRYVSTSDKSNYIIGAYNALTSGSGDCFSYYAVIRMFAEHLGFEQREIERDSQVSMHCWNLIYYNGGWYHLDASRFARGNGLTFMLTNEEAEAWDRAYYSIGHVFDHSLYPEVATKSVQGFVDYTNKTIIGQ